MELPAEDIRRLVPVLERSRELGLLGRGPVEAHISHAAVFSAACVVSPETALDLGSGGGVPGLILALYWPESAWTLVDAMSKRTDFLRSAVAELVLHDRVQVINGRAEELGRREALRGKFDLVTARSFGPPATTAECASPFLCEGGKLVISEPPGTTARWEAEGLAKLYLRQTSSPGAQAAVFLQEEECPDLYPRRTGIPLKRPLF